MKGASLADTHLGRRQFAALVNGRNARSVDVERAWFTAIDQIVAYQPDIVTIAGDVFDYATADVYALRAYLLGVRTLLVETTANVVILQGNHDAARTAAGLTPILLAEGFDDGNDRLHIVTEPKTIELHPTRSSWECVSVTCFPFVTRTQAQTIELKPDPDADVNLLVMHAAVKGSADGDTLPYFYGGDQALNVGDQAAKWDVIAVGDYHEFTRLHPTRMAFYSGSLERVSSNIWQETADKGWVAWDTETGGSGLRIVETRPMVDINWASVAEHEPCAERLNNVLVNLLDSPGPTAIATGAVMPDSIVRLKVDDFPLEEREHIDWKLVNQLKAACLQFYLDIRYKRTETESVADRRENQQTLADEAVAFFADDADDVRDTAFGYMGIESAVEDGESRMARTAREAMEEAGL